MCLLFPCFIEGRFDEQHVQHTLEAAKHVQPLVAGDPSSLVFPGDGPS